MAARMLRAGADADGSGRSAGHGGISCARAWSSYRDDDDLMPG